MSVDCQIERFLLLEKMVEALTLIREQTAYIMRVLGQGHFSSFHTPHELTETDDKTIKRITAVTKEVAEVNDNAVSKNRPLVAERCFCVEIC